MENRLEIERVAFDSEIAGFDVGRITDMKGDFRAMYTEAVARAEKQGLRHLTRRVLGDAWDEIAALEANGFALGDVGVIFDHDLETIPHAKGRLADMSDLDAVVRECATIFRTSRYYHDPLFGPAIGDEVHRRWITNSFKGRAKAIVMPEDRSLVAFVTCLVNGDVGTIELFGVAKSAQGKGVGQALLAASLGWFSKNVSRVEVKTQATNFAAARMYERGGFRLCRTELTYGRAIGSEKGR